MKFLLHLSKVEYRLAWAQGAKGLPLVNSLQRCGGEHVMESDFNGDQQELSPLQQELVEHTVSSCPLAQQIWHYVALFVNYLPKEVTLVLGSLFKGAMPFWSQSTKPFKSNLVNLLESGPLWIIWHPWNDLIFNAIQWPMEKDISSGVGLLDWL